MEKKQAISIDKIMPNPSPTYQFTLDMPLSDGILPFSTSDRSVYSIQYSTYLPVSSLGSTIERSYGSSVTLNGQQAIYLKGLVDKGQISATYTKLSDNQIQGNLKVYSLADFSPRAMVGGPDGNLWIADQNSAVWKVTMSGIGTKYTLTDSYPRGITVGNDSNLWVADQFGAVWKLTTSGNATSYAVGSLGDVSNICQGPDHNLWVCGINSVWKVTTAGSVTNYPIDESSTQDIVAGPDGYLWAADPTTHSVRKIGTNGSGGFYLLSLDAQPVAIAVGSDGDLYLVDGYSNLWKVSTSGDITSYTASISADFSDIVYGPNQCLWACDRSHGIWQINSDGLVELFRTPGYNPNSIAVGSDGNIWVTDSTNSVVIQLT